MTKKKTTKKTTRKKSLPERGKACVRESRALADQIDTCADALGVTKNALYTLGMSSLLARLKPLLAQEVDAKQLAGVLRAEFEAAINV